MHRDAQEFYAALAVAPDASDDAIKHAFRERAKLLHPDAPTGSAAAFIKLKRAFDTLGDPVRRAAYDRANEPHRFAVPPRPERSAFRPPPVTPRRVRRGIGGKVAVFVVMAALSIGAVQLMISFFEAPPSIQARAPGRTESGPAAEPAPAAEAPSAPGSSKSGFWDPTPARKAN